MSELNPSAERDPSFNPDDLYREDTYTDRRIGTIRVLTPVLPSGEQDPAREVEFSGQISVMTPRGALPVGFELPGPTRALLDRIPMMASAVAVLPLPDSPTSATISPGSTENDRSTTARRSPERSAYATRRLSTERSAVMGRSASGAGSSWC